MRADKQPTIMSKLGALKQAALCLLVLTMACGQQLAAKNKDRLNADQLVDNSLKVMQQWDENSKQNVKAMFNLVKARNAYQDREAWSKVQELNAYIFWCDSNLSQDKIRTYMQSVKSKKMTRVLDESFASVQELSGAPVTKRDAQEYFDRAAAFAQANPAKHFRTYLRYYEVQERFIEHSPKIAAEALAKAAEHFDLYRKEAALREEAAYDPAQVFNPPTTGSTTVPNRVALRDSLRQARKLFAEHLRKSGDELIEVPEYMLKTAQNGKRDTDLAYATAVLAAGVAAKVSDLHTIDTIAKWMIENYEGLKYPELMKQFLQEMRGSPAAKAMITLMDQPEDPAANIVLGLHYAMNLQQLKLGWGLMAKGEAANSDIADIGKMELSQPSDALQQKQLAEAYVSLASNRDFRRNEAVIHGSQRRAIYWYSKALPGLKGLNKSEAQEQVESLQKQLPLDLASIDWKRIDEETWKRVFEDIKELGGVAIKVKANIRRTNTGVYLGEGDKVRVVPYPAATWSFRTYSGSEIQVSSYGKGIDYYRNGLSNRYQCGHVAYTFNKSGKTHNLVVGKVISGPGTLYLHPNQPRYYRDMTGKGDCPVLIIPVTK